MKKTDCLCGCKTPTGGEFAPGHDARYKSQLLARLIDHDDSEALQILTKRKWTKFIEPARRQRRIKEERATRVRAKRVRVEREEMGYIYIDAMKAASHLLRMSGQYYRRGRNWYEMTGWRDALVIVSGEHEDVLLEVGPEHWNVIPDRYMNAVEYLLDHIEGEVDTTRLRNWFQNDRELANA